MAGNENSGGARFGAGRKPKHTKNMEIQEQGTFLEIEHLNEECPVANSVLSIPQLDGSTLQAEEIYTNTWAWLEKRGCCSMVSPELLDRYSMMYARWLHCEEHISRLGYLGRHPTTGGEIQSPYVKMSQDYMSHVNRLWLEIYSIVKENSRGSSYGAIVDFDPMEAILRGK